MTNPYGFKVEDINSSCPTDLQPYVEAYKLMQKQKDDDMWNQGRYTMIAFDVVIDRVVSGFAKQKSNAKYPEKPFNILAEEENRELTPEEIDRELKRMIFDENQWRERTLANGKPDTFIK